ncbi:MAG: FmdE family protein [Armatimonadota bacterium]|jgi:formylmethanofuran dehydrogenase subunit E
MSQVLSYDDAARFHGHTCPGLAMGYRAALAALDALGGERALDEELVAVVENDSCAVDAIQAVLGCTFGKGNLVFRDHGRHVYTVYRRGTGEGVRISFRPHERDPDQSREERERFLLAVAQDELLLVEPTTEPVPERAEIEPSDPCDACGQPTMRSRLIEVGGRRLCRPCADPQTAGA